MTVIISDMNGLSWSACVSVYRRLNHHGSLISERSNDVQREHGATGVQESERRLHRDQNPRPSNPSAGGRERESGTTLNVQRAQVARGYAGRV